MLEHTDNSTGQHNQQHNRPKDALTNRLELGRPHGILLRRIDSHTSNFHVLHATGMQRTDIR